MPRCKLQAAVETEYSKALKVTLGRGGMTLLLREIVREIRGSLV
jgi:hypothetical protein